LTRKLSVLTTEGDVITIQFKRVIPVAFATLLLTACGGAAPAQPTTAPPAAAPTKPAAQPASAPSPSAAPSPAPPTTAPAAAKPATSPVAAQPAAAAADQPTFKTWAEVFPAGAGKESALQACGTCHGFDRVVLGQKSAERWTAVKNSHKDKAAGLSDAQLDTLFTYLSQQFGPDKPAPNITGLPVTATSAE
jgi:mono/diheme cytochrome c family protein